MPLQRSAEYWARRAAARMAEEQQSAEERLRALAAPYRRAQAAMLAELRAIQAAYMRRYGVSREEAREFLSQSADERTLRRLARTIERMPAGAEKRRARALLNAPGTRWRISNLQALREQARAVAMELSETEQSLITDSLTRAVRESYLRETYELQRGAGMLYLPQGVSRRFVAEAIREDWSGKNYKTRIEGRYAQLAKRLQEHVLEGFLGGRGRAEKAEELSHEFQMCYHAAKRLLATETTYVVNRAHMEGFRQSGLQEYIIIAILDLRTSDICQEQDGKVYPVAEAAPGENMPPFHPNCRSTVGPVTTREWLKTVERRATDPVTGETVRLAPGTTYREWLRKLEERYGKEKIDALREGEKERVRARNAAVQRKIERDVDTSVLQEKKRKDIIKARKRVPQDWTEKMPITVEVNLERVKGVVPKEAEIHDIVTIAGQGTMTPIRDVERLAKTYQEEKDAWQKKAGIVSGSTFDYEVHWYENNDRIQPEEMKVKGVKEP